MTAGPFPPVADVLPHGGRMVLLSRILEHSARHTACAVEIGPEAMFLESGVVVPAWIGIEYMAQCVAAHAGLRALARGEPAKIGFLAGSRRVDFHTSGFTVGQELLVVVTHVWGEAESASFAGRVLDAVSGGLLVEGSLSVFRPETLERFRPSATP